MAKNKTIDPNKNVVLKASQVTAAIERMDKVLGYFNWRGKYRPWDDELEMYLKDLRKSRNKLQYKLEHQHELTEDVIFLCDGKQCEVCHNNECCHTTDITYAKNFEKIGDSYWEVEDVESITDYLDDTMKFIVRNFETIRPEVVDILNKINEVKRNIVHLCENSEVEDDRHDTL